MKKAIAEKADQDDLIDDLRAQLRFKQKEVEELKDSGHNHCSINPKVLADEDISVEMEKLRLENSSKTTQLEQLLQRFVICPSKSDILSELMN